MIARDLGMMHSESEGAISDCEEVARIINGLIRSISNRRIKNTSA